jgi:hypothetical protein
MSVKEGMMKRWVLLTGLLSMLLASTVFAGITMQRLVQGSHTAVLSISGLANNSRSAAGTMYDPRIAGAGLGYLNVIVECVMTFSVAPTAGTSISVWFLKQTDGTNFETTTTPRVPDVVCPVLAVTSTQRVSFSRQLEAFPFQAIALNDATAQTLTTGTINIRPSTIQGN